MTIRVMKDGRTIRTGKDYTKFRHQLHAAQWGMCLKCGRNTSLTVDLISDFSFHVAHNQTRGMGSSFRDDVLGTKKGQIKGGLCGRDHRMEHNER